MVTGSISAGAGMVLPDGRKVAFTAKDKGHEDTPDEDRVNRGTKKGRVVAVETMQPPKDFSAWLDPRAHQDALHPELRSQGQVGLRQAEDPGQGNPDRHIFL